MAIIMQCEGADLFESGADILVNTVNTRGVMGAGIALQFKRRFPDMFAAYRQRCLHRLVSTGSIDVHIVETAESPASRCLIANFPTKQEWRNPSRLEWIESGLSALRLMVEQHRARSVAIPPLGCGLGGLDWDIVSSLITEAMTPVAEAGVDVLVYPPAPR